MTNYNTYVGLLHQGLQHEIESKVALKLITDGAIDLTYNLNKAMDGRLIDLTELLDEGTIELIKYKQIVLDALKFYETIGGGDKSMSESKVLEYTLDGVSHGLQLVKLNIDRKSQQEQDPCAKRHIEAWVKMTRQHQSECELILMNMDEVQGIKS